MQWKWKSHFSILNHQFPRRGFGLEASSCAYFWVASNRRFSQTQAPRCSDEFPVSVRVPFHSVGFPLCMQGFAIQCKVPVVGWWWWWCLVTHQEMGGGHERWLSRTAPFNRGDLLFTYLSCGGPSVRNIAFEWVSLHSHGASIPSLMLLPHILAPPS